MILLMDKYGHHEYINDKKPREIPDEHDLEWWDMEARKLQLIEPFVFEAYAVLKPLTAQGSGARGLYVLGFITNPYTISAFDTARVANFGAQLVEACERVKLSAQIALVPGDSLTACDQ